MSYAGARITEIFTTLFERHDPIDGAEVLVEHVGGTIWRCVHWHVDLVVLASVVVELEHLLYHHPRDPEDVELVHLFVLGLAVGTLSHEMPDLWSTILDKLPSDHKL